MLLANKFPTSPNPGRGFWQGAVSLTADFFSVKATAWPWQPKTPCIIGQARGWRRFGSLARPGNGEGHLHTSASLSDTNGPGEPPLFIGVAGGTASGKTSLCAKIMKQLEAEMPGPHGLINLSQDSFYRDLTPTEAANVKAFNFDHPDAFAFDEIVETLRNLRAGLPVDIPVYSFVDNARLPSERLHIPSADVILFDGILAFYKPELRNLFDIKLFVDTDADTRLARRLRRDIVERGRDVLQVLSQYESTVKPSFNNYILPTKEHADIIVPGGAENEVAVHLIVQHIRWKLSHRVALT